MPTLDSLEQRAIDFARSGDFGADARTVNEEITRLAPANQGAWTRLARCCLEMGQLDEATAALDAALQLNPQNTIARNLQAEVSRRRAGPAADMPAPRRRAPSGSSTATRLASRSAARAGRAGSVLLPGIGRAEFTALGHLPPAAAAESLTGRIEPLLMALNDRPFAAKAVDARNRAGRAGDRLFRRGTLQPVAPGQIEVYQQGGRWEPQLNIRLCAAAHYGRDCLGAGIAFNLSEGGTDDRAEADRERAILSFESFQQQLASAWRQHLTDWMRATGGFVQQGTSAPATDVLPYDAVQTIIDQRNPAAAGRIFAGRWLFADRGDDIGVLIDGGRLVKWIEGTFTDLLPLWGTVYRGR